MQDGFVLGCLPRQTWHAKLSGQIKSWKVACRQQEADSGPFLKVETARHQRDRNLCLVCAATLNPIGDICPSQVVWFPVSRTVE